VFLFIHLENFMNESMKRRVAEAFALNTKIDSYEAYKQALDRAGFNGRDYETNIFSYVEYRGRTFDGIAGVSNLDGESILCSLRYVSEKKNWWARRELLRQESGAYERTDTMAMLVDRFFLHHFFIACSPSEKGMVIYTPDAESGARDKQVKTTFGRLFRKLLPLLTDNQVRVMEEEHLAELDDSFLVATSIEDVERVYRTMRGDTGCMRHDPSDYDLPDDVHPSHFYAEGNNGVGVAYLEVGGNITARTVIYVNPKDPTDKRFVRLYGDYKLEKKLKLQGYRCASLAGIDMPAIELPNAERHYPDWNPASTIPLVIPYLDGPGGAQSVYDGATGYYNPEKRTVRLMSESERIAVSLFTGRTFERFKNTASRHLVPVISPDSLAKTCGLTGKRVVIGDEDFEFLDVVRVDAQGRPEFLNVLKSAAKDAGMLETHMRCQSLPGKTDTSVIVHMTHDTRDALQVHVGDGNYIIRGDHAMAKGWGYDLLSAKYYGENQYSSNACRLENGDSVLTVDAYSVIKWDAVEEENKITYVHRSEMAELKKSRDFQAVISLNGMKTWAERKHPRLVTLISGKSAIHGLHSISQLFDGRYERTVNTTTLNYNGVSVRVLASNVAPPDLRTSTEFNTRFTGRPLNLTRSVRKWQDDVLGMVRGADVAAVKSYMDRQWDKPLTAAKTSVVIQFAGRGSNKRYFFLTEGIVRVSGYSSPSMTYDSLLETAAAINAATDETLDGLMGAVATIDARNFAHIVGMVASEFEQASQMTTIWRAKFEKYLNSKPSSARISNDQVELSSMIDAVSLTDDTPVQVTVQAVTDDRFAIAA
jgi:hypothetical protein